MTLHKYNSSLRCVAKGYKSASVLPCDRKVKSKRYKVPLFSSCAHGSSAAEGMPGRDLRFSIDRGGTFTDVFLEVCSCSH